jgi:hypothetical protein
VCVCVCVCVYLCVRLGAYQVIIHAPALASTVYS